MRDPTTRSGPAGALRPKPVLSVAIFAVWTAVAAAVLGLAWSNRQLYTIGPDGKVNPSVDLAFTAILIAISLVYAVVATTIVTRTRPVVGWLLLVIAIGFPESLRGRTVRPLRVGDRAGRSAVYSVSLIPIFFAGSFIVPRAVKDIAIPIAFVVGLNGMAASIAIAVLRYRLYDIDRVVSRTVSYALVAGIMLGAYVGLVVLLQRASRPLTGSSDLAVAVSTLIVAAGFVPLRRRIHSGVDRRFNRARYDAAHTIDAFTARLRDEVDIDALGDELTDVVAHTVHPAHVSLWIREGSR